MTGANIVLVGVGGQGTLLASRILGALAIKLGYDVKVSEVHGMAQRGGSVVTFVRMGRGNIRSPLVEAAGADYVLAFEQLEAARAIPYLKKGGVMIVNTQKILPMPVITGAAPYPELLGWLKERARVVALDAMGMAVEAGVDKAVNLVLLGALCAQVRGDKAPWLSAIEECVPPKLLEANLRAFEAGYQAVLTGHQLDGF